MAQSLNPESPNSRLASIIADALCADGFVPRTRATDLQQKLTEGTMKETDWRLFIEMTLPDQARGTQHA